MGNRRGVCRTCNNFAQRVRRLAATSLKSRHEAEYDELRADLERDLYAELLSNWGTSG